MAEENSLKVFSLRLKKPLAEQIEARCVVSRRTRNAEIVLLLEQAIDIAVERDRKMLKASKSED